MHESMTSQKIKKLGAGGPKLLVGGPWPPRWLRACGRATLWASQPNGVCPLTEAIIFDKRQRLTGMQTSAGVSVAGTVVHFAEAVKLLGVTLDSALTFSQHATNVIRACTTTHALYVIFDRCSLSIPRMIATTIVVQGWTIVIVYCMAPRKATSTDFSMYRINLRMLYYRHHGLLVLWTCAVNFIGCQ